MKSNHRWDYRSEQYRQHMLNKSTLRERQRNHHEDTAYGEATWKLYRILEIRIVNAVITRYLEREEPMTYQEIAEEVETNSLMVARCLSSMHRDPDSVSGSALEWIQAKDSMRTDMHGNTKLWQPTEAYRQQVIQREWDAAHHDHWSKEEK